MQEKKLPSAYAHVVVQIIVKCIAFLRDRVQFFLFSVESVFSVAKKHCTGMQEIATERSTMRRPQVSLTKSV